MSRRRRKVLSWARRVLRDGATSCDGGSSRVSVAVGLHVGLVVLGPRGVVIRPHADVPIPDGSVAPTPCAICVPSTGIFGGQSPRGITGHSLTLLSERVK